MNRSPEIEAIVRGLVAARIDGAANLALSSLSNSEQIRIMGSDEHEWQEGQDHQLRPVQWA